MEGFLRFCFEIILLPVAPVKTGCGFQDVLCTPGVCAHLRSAVEGRILTRGLEGCEAARLVKWTGRYLLQTAPKHLLMSLSGAQFFQVPKSTHSFLRWSWPPSHTLTDKLGPE